MKFNIPLKISIITLILTICIRISTDFFAFSSENTLNLESAKSKEVYGNIGVALTTNIGIRYKERTELPARSYQTVIEVSDILGKEAIINDEILRVNMLFLQDYLNLMKTDINELLQNGGERKTALETLITQLELRYKNATKNLQTIVTQRSFLIQKMGTLDGQITALKIRINQDFKNADTVATIENKNEYLRLKAEWMESRTYIIYFNQFVQQYAFLNTYNKKILDTLINNKDIITKNSYVVFPDSGTSILKDLNLILDESEYKTSEKKISGE